MNYSDFPDLQTDDFCGTRFGDQGQLEVIGWSGKKGSNKLHIVLCHTCRTDTDDGLYKTLLYKLKSGHVPCPCQQKYKDAQLTEQFRSMAGIHGKTVFTRNKVKLHASSGYTYWDVKCGGCRATSIVSTYHLTSGRWSCVACKANKAQRDTEFVKEFTALGIYDKRTMFKRIPDRTGWWSVTCGACSIQYQQSTTRINLGCKLCECGEEERVQRRDIKRMSREMARPVKEPKQHIIKEPPPPKLPRQLKTKKEFVAEFLASGCWTRTTKFNMLEEEGRKNLKWEVTCSRCRGVWISTTGQLKRGMKGCDCGGQTKEAYINTVTDGETTIAVKFGISTDSTRRAAMQDRKSPHTVSQLFTYSFAKVHWCRNAESECKKTFTCGIISKADMPDGYTETTYLYNIDKIRAIYEKHGGVLVS